MRPNKLSMLGILLLFNSFLINCGRQPYIHDNAEQPDRIAENNMLRGVEYMKLAKYDIALKALQSALGQDPNYASAHGVIAVLYERLEEIDKARYHHKQAIKLNPMDSNIQNNYGQFLCKQGQQEAAYQRFLQAVDNPVYSTPHIPYTNAALCALRFKNPSKAKSFLRKALQANPQFETALYHMADTHYQFGEFKLALDYLKRYEAVAQHTLQTLWLGIQIQRALEQTTEEAKYAALLRSQYPDSEEAYRLRQLEKPR